MFVHTLLRFISVIMTQWYPEVIALHAMPSLSDDDRKNTRTIYKQLMQQWFTAHQQIMHSTTALSSCQEQDANQGQTSEY
jgi:hypothetical protein